jgi:hypothetical protein
MSRKAKWFSAAGVLLALVLGFAIYQAKQQEAEERAIERNAAPLVAALERYKAEKGAYPKDLSPLVPAYIATVPECPGMSRPMPYRFEEAEKGYEIYCPTGWLLKRGYRSAVSKWETYE